VATFDYAALKADVDAILAEFGQDCKLRRAGAPVVVDPVEGTVAGAAPVEHDAIGVVVDYEDKVVDGETILRGDRLVYIEATTRPQAGDIFVEANGTEWSVVDYDAVDPAGVPVVFALQVRR
jgi:hypothetical protein